MRTDVDVLVPVRNGGRLLRRAVRQRARPGGRRASASSSSTTARPTARSSGCRATRGSSSLRNAGRGIPGGAEHRHRAPATRRTSRARTPTTSRCPGASPRSWTFLEAQPGHRPRRHRASRSSVGGRSRSPRWAAARRACSTTTRSARAAVVVRREVIEQAGGLPRGVHAVASDYDCWLRCAWVVRRGVLPDRGYRYRLDAVDVDDPPRAARRRRLRRARAGERPRAHRRRARPRRRPGGRRAQPMATEAPDPRPTASCRRGGRASSPRSARAARRSRCALRGRAALPRRAAWTLLARGSRPAAPRRRRWS